MFVTAVPAAQKIDDASLARIRRALEQPPPRLDLSVPRADFRTGVEVRHPFADLFDLPPWITPPTGVEAPRISGNGRVAQLGSIDPGAIGHSIANKIRARKAHAEVIQAITEYCAAHRDEPGAAGICGGTPR
jgi:hypothetical protein